MAERIVSPGVFTREKDLSFLPQGIGEIGAALMGSTIKGPAFVPTVVDSFQQFQQIFGGLSDESYLPYAAKYYLQDAGTATIVRVLGQNGYEVEDTIALQISSSAGTKVAAVLHPTREVSDFTNVFGESILTGVSASNFVIELSGSTVTGGADNTYSSSLDPTNPNYIAKALGFSPKGNQSAYVYSNFRTFQSASFATNEVVEVSVVSGTLDYGHQYKEATTPWITSQKVGGTATNLFKIHTLSHGTATNYEFKVAISDVKPAGTVPGSEYGSFTVTLRRVDQNRIPNSPFVGVTDSDIRPNLVESFQNVNLDPDSANYIARVIGDKFITVDSNGKVSTNGDYNNNSVNIRVEVSNAVANKAVNAELVPFGFAVLLNPFDTEFEIPEPTYVSDQLIGGSYNSRKHYGFDYNFASSDNLNLLAPIAGDTQVGTAFYLGDYNQAAEASFPSPTSAYSGSIDLSSNTSIDSRKFIVPFQSGFDGYAPNRQVSMNGDILPGNTQGWDCSDITSEGTVAFRKAINTVSNPDEYDINMLVIPGLLHRYHPAVTQYAINMCEDRQDTFYVMDSSAYGDSINQAVNNILTVDSNYVATYYPWVKVLNTDKNKPVWVPPSAVLPGVIAFNDQVAAEWFAPAGLTRGGLTNVIETETRLTRAERDVLYDGRVNPIATFPGQGVTVFGQKTLQGRPSALDRINVRRLLIAVKKFIASSSRFLVFEQNTSATRNRFLSIVNPYLESIQQRQGLFAFRVIMDETNNTPDVIDRNILVGEIFLQPTKTAEFIVLDFNVLPTGASFPE